jgi:glycosidase
MAEDTPLNYRNLVLYELFVRNHGPHGTFADVSNDLPRIREMGVDILWLMPVHPIGFVTRQGKWGSPYAILDYTAINSEFGTKTDFCVHAKVVRQQMGD